MDERDAIALIDDAIVGHGNSWADIGAGSGTFTRALRSLLQLDSRIYAVDHDKDAISNLREIGSGVIPVEADFTAPFALPGNPALDGILLANALHFVPNPGGSAYERGQLERDPLVHVGPAKATTRLRDGIDHPTTAPHQPVGDPHHCLVRSGEWRHPPKVVGDRELRTRGIPVTSRHEAGRGRASDAGVAVNEDRLAIVPGAKE
jgi:hypothetical protein